MAQYPPDWNCSNCGDLQFARNSTCRKCGTPKEGGEPNPDAVVESRPANGGDWNCPACGDLVFGRNANCRKCGAARPGGGAGAGMVGQPTATGGFMGQLKPGDWNCPACNDLQFAKNAQCRRCGTPRPTGQQAFAGQQAVMGQQGFQMQQVMVGGVVGAGGFVLQNRPGDWQCPQCGDHVFAKNDTCRRCSCPKPENPTPPNTPQPAIVTQPVMMAQQPMMVQQGVMGQPVMMGQQGMMGQQAVMGQQVMPGQQFMMVQQGSMGQQGTMSESGLPPGDWACPSCSDHQFARNTKCRRCGTPRPLGSGGCMMVNGAPIALQHRPGDWSCPTCGDHVFARNTSCRKCNTPKPDGALEDGLAAACGGGAAPPAHFQKPGDWSCPACGDLVFGRNDQCRRCGTLKPPGDSPSLPLTEGAVVVGADAARSRSRSPKGFRSEGFDFPLGGN